MQVAVACVAMYQHAASSNNFGVQFSCGPICHWNFARVRVSHTGMDRFVYDLQLREGLNLKGIVHKILHLER